MYQQCTHRSQCTCLLISPICSIYMYSCYSWLSPGKNYASVGLWCLEHIWHHFNQAGELCGVCACAHVCGVQSLLLHIHTYLLCVTIIRLIVYNSICNWYSVSQLCCTFCSLQWCCTMWHTPTLNCYSLPLHLRCCALTLCGTRGPDEGSCGNYTAMLARILNVLTGRYAHPMSVVSVVIHALPNSYHILTGAWVSRTLACSMLWCMLFTVWVFLSAVQPLLLL